MDVSKIIDRYCEELGPEIRLNKLSLDEQQLTLPSLKHKWASRFINHKKNLIKLKNEKKSIFKNLVHEYIENSPVKINLNIAEKAVINNKKILIIDEKIEQENLILEYLEKIQNIVNNIQWDIKNLIELEKLETQ